MDRKHAHIYNTVFYRYNTGLGKALGCCSDCCLHEVRTCCLFHVDSVSELVPFRFEGVLGDRPRRARRHDGADHALNALPLCTVTVTVTVRGSQGRNDAGHQQHACMSTLAACWQTSKCRTRP